MRTLLFKTRSSGRRAEDRAAKAHWRSLSSALETIREDERRAIARELHDDPAQLLALLRLDLNQLMNCGGDRAGQNALLETMDQRLMAVLTSVRRLALNLRPRALDEDGLFYALQGLRRDFTQQHGIPCELFACEQDLCLGDAQATAVFRVIQQALANVARHAHASQVVITLSRVENHLSARVEDNGCGISATSAKRSGAMGILGMQERIESLGGVFSLGAGVPKGTRCDMSLPLEQVSSHNL